MPELLQIAVDVSAGLMILAVLLGFVRLVKGPSLPDRVVALDMMTICIVAFCGLAAIRYNEKAFLDVALVLALVGFLATVALARFAERNTARREQQRQKEMTNE